jgi:hypothetical protein
MQDRTQKLQAYLKTLNNCQLYKSANQLLTFSEENWKDIGNFYDNLTQKPAESWMAQALKKGTCIKLETKNQL